MTLVLALALGATGWFGLGRRRQLGKAGEGATTERARERAAEAESRKLEAIVRGMSEGVLVTDSDGQTSFTNPQWRELFDRDGGEEGVDVSDATWRAALAQMIATTRETGEGQRLEIQRQ